MAIRITNDDEYRKANDRLQTLRASGESVASNDELAELEAALEAYGMKPKEPDESKGKPRPDPYGKA